MSTVLTAVDWPTLAHSIRHEFIKTGNLVKVGEWQALRDNRPQTRTIEIEDLTIEASVPDHIGQWQSISRPNLPWAEDHFQERISGIAYNPPPSASYWPFAQKDNEETRTEEGGKFSHTYPERFWPNADMERFGIRYGYGDLWDLIELLANRPYTRQAYLPIWFPEDLSAANKSGARVPCTLGYHFLRRGNRMKVVYYMRSCDFYRYLADDMYMAGRLLQHVVEKVNEFQPNQDPVEPDRLVMHISSLHIFEDELGRLRSEYEQRKADMMNNLGSLL